MFADDAIDGIALGGVLLLSLSGSMLWYDCGVAGSGGGGGGGHSKYARRSESN